MVVGMGGDPSLGEYGKLLQSMKITTCKELVLLHPDGSVVGSTREWLKVGLARGLSAIFRGNAGLQNRPWIHQHLHVELPVWSQLGSNLGRLADVQDMVWHS